MMERSLVVGVLAVACVGATGCLATRDFVRENLARSETRVDQRIDDARGEAARRATEVAGRAEEAARLAGHAGTRAEEASGLAARAQATAEQTDARLTRLWVNRNRRTVVETLVLRFGFDRAQLDDRAETSLLEVARQLADNPDATVDIEGYTDAMGAADYNVELSRRRAEAVRRFLVMKGIELHRVHTIGLGPVRPAASNATKRGRDQNRRVLVKLVMPAE